MKGKSARGRNLTVTCCVFLAVCRWVLAENQARVEVETGETLKHVSGVQCVNTAAETEKKKGQRQRRAAALIDASFLTTFRCCHGYNPPESLIPMAA